MGNRYHRASTNPSRAKLSVFRNHKEGGDRAEDNCRRKPFRLSAETGAGSAQIILGAYI